MTDSDCTFLSSASSRSMANQWPNAAYRQPDDVDFWHCSKTTNACVIWEEAAESEMIIDQEVAMG